MCTNVTTMQPDYIMANPKTSPMLGHAQALALSRLRVRHYAQARNPCENMGRFRRSRENCMFHWPLRMEFSMEVKKLDRAYSVRSSRQQKCVGIADVKNSCRSGRH